MAKIQFMSDLHFEFLTMPEVRTLAQSVASASTDIAADYLALCGDITTTSHQGDKKLDNVQKFIDFLTIVSKEYAAVLHVAGNHEFYHKNREVGYAKTVFYNTVASAIDNYYFLDNATFTTEDDKVIAGTTLWFSYDDPNVYVFQNWMNDFNQISGSHDFIKPESEKSLDFIKRHTQVDLLMTHHGVTPKTPEQYANHPANIYYYTDITEELYRLKPKYAIHGHTHVSMEYQVGETIVMTNPHGYNRENPMFDVGKYVEI